MSKAHTMSKGTVPLVWAMWLAACLAQSAFAADAAPSLRAYVRQSYPSLLYVERFRRAFPREIQGDDSLWAANGAGPALSTSDDVVHALVGLQDQHVALAGARADKPETLGMLFRTSSDGHMLVWRIFDPALTSFVVGDQVMMIDGVPTAKWLERAAAVTFGGNRRSRAAEAAFNLGAGSRVVHRTAGVGDSVALTIRRNGAELQLSARYRPMDEALTAAMTQAIGRDDLPRALSLGDYRIGTVRLGAFAPQYDPLFNAAADAAGKRPGVSDDQAMLEGFCAVVRRFIADFDELAARSDAIVLDLRGNLGGFGREARLIAAAMQPAAMFPTYDVFATATPGVSRMTAQPRDASCGRVSSHRPVIVFDDAGTRSAGESMAAWLWAAGSPVVGERTIGAGGGFEFGSQTFTEPHSGYGVRISGNFTVLDPTGQLREGEMPEREWVDLVAQDSFAPNRQRPFSVQAAGMRPDLDSASTLADLRDGGEAQLLRTMAELRRRGLLK